MPTPVDATFHAIHGDTSWGGNSASKYGPHVLASKALPGSIPVSRTTVVAAQTLYLDSLHKLSSQYQDDRGRAVAHEQPPYARPRLPLSPGKSVDIGDSSNTETDARL
jgi:hypothetical protein